MGGCEDDGWEREEFGGEFGYEGEGRESAVSEWVSESIIYIAGFISVLNNLEYMNMEVFNMLAASWASKEIERRQKCGLALHSDSTTNF